MAAGLGKKKLMDPPRPGRHRGVLEYGCNIYREALELEGCGWCPPPGAIEEERKHVARAAKQAGIPEQGTMGQWEVLVQEGKGKQIFKCREAECLDSGEVCVWGGVLSKKSICPGQHKLASIQKSGRSILCTGPS